jgi:hypothetical protein
MYTVAAFPFIVPPFFITVSLTNFMGKMTKPKNVTVRIEDPTNSIILANLSGQVNAAADYDFTGSEVVEMPFPMMPFPILHAGRYLIDVLVDGEKLNHRDLMVYSMTAAQMLPPPQKPQT